MMALFEQQGGTYQKKGDYFIPCVVTKKTKEVHIGVWANRHRQYLKQFHRVRYYNHNHKKNSKSHQYLCGYGWLCFFSIRFVPRLQFLLPSL